MSTTPAQILVGVYVQYWQSLGLLAAAQLGIADELGECPRHVDDIARGLSVNAQSLARLMRALSCRGIFRQVNADEFTHTALSKSLRTGSPGGAKEIIQAMGIGSIRSASLLYERAIITGRSAFELIGNGADPQSPQALEEGRSYDAAMTAASDHQADSLMHAFDFSGFSPLVDVGGGQGALLAHILASNPSQRGVLFDLPRVVAAADMELDRRGVASRCEVFAGDFRWQMVPGGRGYILKNILHGRDDRQCDDLLRRIHLNAASGARVLIIELVMPAQGCSAFHTGFDLFLLLGGAQRRVRCAREFQMMLEGAGFDLIRVVPTDCLLNVIEAKRRDD
jgi:C-methyltransferase